jgi:23S rRNA (uridine2552-2'-O)-methyltransferase
VRQTKDPFVRAARDAQYRSRAAFKLIQLDQKYRIFNKAKLVLDLGAAPGGWSQIASSRMSGNSRAVIAIDLLEMEPIAKVDFIQGDFTRPEALEKITELCRGRSLDVILSDMSPNLSGIGQQDHIRSMDLVKTAFTFSRSALRPGGHFVAKIFDGNMTKDLKEAMATIFTEVEWAKPEASRKESSEMYILGLGKK